MPFRVSQNPKPKSKRGEGGAETMAKSMRCKREKRLRAIRREMVEPYYDKKDEAKLAAQEAALAAPKLPVRPPPKSTSAMEVTTTNGASTSTSNMDVDMDAVNERIAASKPAGGVSKKSKRVFKVGKGRRHGKGGKVKRRHI